MSIEALREFDKVQAEMCDEAQSRLPVEDRIATGEMCLDEHEGYKCTKQKDHPPGDHIAHGILGTVMMRWLGV